MNCSRRIALFACFVALPAAQGQTWHASRVWVTGADHHTWVIGAADTADKVLPELQIWYMGEASPGLLAPSLLAALPPLTGNPLFAGADESALRVFFSDLTQYDYRPAGAHAPGPPWRGVCRKPPLAWCGDAAEESVWAVVIGEHLVPPTTQPPAEEESDEDEPAADSPAGAPAAASMPTARYALLHQRRGVWARVGAPDEADEAEQFWLAARAGEVYLFWMEGKVLRVSTLKDAQWSAPKVVTADAAVRLAWPGVTEAHAVMVLGVDAGNDRINLHILAPGTDGEWTRLGVARENEDYLSLDPLRSSVAICRGRLSVARIGAGGAVEYGEGDTATREPIRFVPLSLRRPDPEMSSDWGDSLSLAMALMILTVVMWTRRQQLTGEIVLPEGLVPSAVWRRIMATFIDIAPAVLIVVPFVARSIPELSHIGDLRDLQTRIDEPVIKQRLVPLQFATVVIYGLWCMIWEMVISTTPGKYFFGCRVLSVTGDRPRPRQIVVRNIVRTIMVGIGSPGLIITLMMMGMLSRNRQRVGDLMAGTIVVEDGMPEEQQPPPTDEGPFG